MTSTILVGQAVGARNTAQTKCGVGTGFFVVLSMTMAILGHVFTADIFDAMGTQIDAQSYAMASQPPAAVTILAAACWLLAG